MLGIPLATIAIVAASRGGSALVTPAVVAAIAAVGVVAVLAARGARLTFGDVGRRGADRGPLSETAELTRHLETVLAALLDLRSDNARLREDLTRSISLVQRANRLASVGLLTAGLAHEMRNPLVALRTFAQLLPTRWEDGEFRQEFADVVLNELDRVGHLLNDLLLFARNQSAAFEEASLGDVLATVVPLLRAHAVHKQIAVELVVDDGSPCVTANVAQLRQVVMNLGLNALQATPEGGRVRIATSTRDGAELPIAVVRVSDSGPGIAPEDVARIFDPFFTTRPEGTGLGLPISREIVERHGGTLVVESVPGAGATFAVEIPAVAAVATAATPHAPARAEPSSAPS